MAEFQIQISADHPGISFDLMLRGVTYLVCLSDGNWQLRHDGGLKQIARDSVHWTEALRRALETIETDQRG